MNRACRNGHIRLVQWILANVEHIFYSQNINMFDIETVLQTITPESQSNTSESDSDNDLKTWRLCRKKINRRISQSDNALINTEEHVEI